MPKGDDCAKKGLHELDPVLGRGGGLPLEDLGLLFCMKPLSLAEAAQIESWKNVAEGEVRTWTFHIIPQIGLLLQKRCTTFVSTFVDLKGNRVQHLYQHFIQNRL
jgi:hypothetical protein